MKESGLSSIKNEFLDIYSALQNLADDEILSGPDDIFRFHFERLQSLIARAVDDCLVEELLGDREFRIIVKRLSHLKRLNGLRMEIEYAKSIIASSDPWASIKRFPYYLNYLKLARMEYQGANLKPGNQVVFLGSGPMPLTLISFCKQFSIKGVGIEQIPEYVELSRKILEILELTGSISIVQGNHFSLSLKEEYQLVMVGADAYPKDEIFTYLAKKLSIGAKLSYRIYEKGLRRFIDGRPISDLPPEFQEYTRIRPEPPVNNTSVFLVKIKQQSLMT